MGFARTIVEEPTATDALDRYRTEYERFDELWIGWTWRLARDPLAEAFQLPGIDPPAYLIKSGDLSRYGLPSSVTILYRVTEDEVIIISVRAVSGTGATNGE
jgi:hypothetical protein